MLLIIQNNASKCKEGVVGFYREGGDGTAREQASRLCTNVCIECIGQSAKFVCSNRTLGCPPGSYKLHRLSAPIYTALFVQNQKPCSLAAPGVGGGRAYMIGDEERSALHDRSGVIFLMEVVNLLDQ